MKAATAGSHRREVLKHRVLEEGSVADDLGELLGVLIALGHFDEAGHEHKGGRH
jgi:hypothetical protein